MYSEICLRFWMTLSLHVHVHVYNCLLQWISRSAILFCSYTYTCGNFYLSGFCSFFCHFLTFCCSLLQDLFVIYSKRTVNNHVRMQNSQKKFTIKLFKNKIKIIEYVVPIRKRKIIFLHFEIRSKNSLGPDHFALVSFSFTVQIRL